MGAATVGLASAAVANTSAATVSESGSSLVYPLVVKWSQTYTADSVQPHSTGSGKGINLVQIGQINIGTSDAPMTSSQYGAAKQQPVQIPWALSATGVGYHIQGVGYGLKLTGPILAEIFSGKIKSWGTAAIVKLNPKYAKALKKAGPITPVVRSDGSGDSYAFQQYLTIAGGKAWNYSYSTSWGSPVGTGENGNSGVAGEVATNKGTIGYISAYYLINQHITTAAIENSAGNFEFPNSKNIANAAASNSTLPAQGANFTGVSIVDPSKRYKIAYPISTYTYAIVNPNQSNDSDIKAFLTWATTTGQAYGAALDFVPLPAKVRTSDAALINGL
ncbi:MAG TPA: phosphate ABC transporter substrate-binding protein PstS [Solirubrobacteraceae bacterium]|nr:phosphate ABC transporter substrate-binding protein PstS [Solirubrobacteraceae bacterium]